MEKTDPIQADSTDTDITELEKTLLDNSTDNPTTEDDNNLQRSELDNTDDDGELLNEESSADDQTGQDLDVPGAGDDDSDEMIGEEDEENNSYSQADTE